MAHEKSEGSDPPPLCRAWAWAWAVGGGTIIYLFIYLVSLSLLVGGLVGAGFGGLEWLAA